MVSSRVCTPAPSPPQQQSPVQIDPHLMNVLDGEERRVVTIPLTVEELRGLITEAVQIAMLGAGGRNSVEDSNPVSSGGDGVKEEQD